MEIFQAVVMTFIVCSLFYLSLDKDDSKKSNKKPTKKHI